MYEKCGRGGVDCRLGEGTCVVALYGTCMNEERTAFLLWREGSYNSVVGPSNDVFFHLIPDLPHTGIVLIKATRTSQGPGMSHTG